ncbi:hypothetical protein AK88_04785 [Plasmodium fragile]|uniref:Transmembrane protein n=1 Tax=Plasmodium fragile TaxID=5857 RepID=A0A0D9QF00_PLAFR|nr:uncharacterized protein AK88_04785 [Plasmodium fragile]KJP85564.1 hypothetical protein AK88_04785 [Plasmodium fragile]
MITLINMSSFQFDFNKAKINNRNIHYRIRSVVFLTRDVTILFIKIQIILIKLLSLLFLGILKLYLLQKYFFGYLNYNFCNNNNTFYILKQHLIQGNYSTFINPKIEYIIIMI